MIKRAFFLSAAFAAIISLGGCTTAPAPGVASAGTGGKQSYTEDAPSLGSGIRKTYTADNPNNPAHSNVETADMRNLTSGSGGGGGVLGAGR
jgi:hypothetical protein